jgi:hypothetical protein
MNRTRLTAAALTLTLALMSWGVLGSDYTNTASVFELALSVRAIGMGGAFIGVSDDDAAVFYNPAGLTRLDATTSSSLFTRPFGAYSYSVLSIADRGWGAQLLLLDSGTLQERDLYGFPTGTLRHTETGFVIAGGITAAAGMSLGLQAKVYALALPTQGFGASLSPSLLYQEGPRTYGIVWRNVLNTGLGFVGGHTEPWVRDLVVGLAWQAGTTLFAIDFTERVITRGDIASLRAGVESTYFHPITLRVGTYREGSSVGASVLMRGFRVDLAYVLHYALPDSYYVALNYGWDTPLWDVLTSPFRWLASLLR